MNFNHSFLDLIRFPADDEDADDPVDSASSSTSTLDASSSSSTSERVYGQSGKKRPRIQRRMEPLLSG